MYKIDYFEDEGNKAFTYKDRIFASGHTLEECYDRLYKDTGINITSSEGLFLVAELREALEEWSENEKVFASIPSNLEIQAGIERLNAASLELTVIFLIKEAGYNRETIFQQPYYDIFTSLLSLKARNEYQERYEKLLKEQNAKKS